MEYKQQIVILHEEAADVKSICESPPGRSVRRDSVVYSWTAKYDNGFQSDTKVCASGDPSSESCWCETVLFDENGCELSASEVADDPFGEWILEYNQDTFVVNVTAEVE